MQINSSYSASYMASANRSMQKIAGDTKRSFSDVAVMKAEEVDSKEVSKKTSAILDSIGSRAPDEVKQAWMESEEETSAFFTVFGLYISKDGKHAHMTQMGIDRFVRWYRGEFNENDLLGNSVGSAIKAVNKWIYDVDHPLPGSPARSSEDQQLIMKEREFYEVFLDKLLGLSKKVSQT
ncbi:MAG: hypothetical protein NC548_54080 [Lachnospiraceae bacterium]|nr:hypothetical protein [Lachnospiraceae bacterium]